MNPCLCMTTDHKMAPNRLNVEAFLVLIRCFFDGIGGEGVVA